MLYRLRDLTHLHHLESLQRLYLGMNRIQDLCELEKLQPLTQLLELSLVSCPVSRRLMHRPLLIYRMPSLMVIDGIPVSEEEQLKASLYYSQQEVSSAGFSSSNRFLLITVKLITNTSGQYYYIVVIDVICINLK